MRNWLVVAVSLLLWLMLVSAAYAGEWTQVTCTQPNGQPAPIEGWSAEGIDGPGDDSSAYSTCEQPGGALVAESSNEWPQTRESAWAWHFSAPSGSTIADGTLSLDLYAPLGRSYVATPNNIYDGADVFRNCQFNEPCSSNDINGGPFAGTVSITHPGPNIYAEAQCEGAGQPGSPTANCGVGEGANGVNAQTMVYAADIELANSSTPAGTAFGGTLLEAGTSGNADLTFSAEDPSGPGVYRVTAMLDGTSVYHETPEANGGSCASIGKDSSGVAEFLHAQPCKQAVAVDIPLDTTKFADGSHTLKVEVEDVAGNKSVVLDRKVSFSNHPPSTIPTSPSGGGSPGGSSTGDSTSSSAVVSLVTSLASTSIGPGSPLALRGPANGTNASDAAELTARWAQTSNTVLTSRYGMPERVTGRLTTSAGQPISGALIDVYATPGYEGAQARLSDAGLRTNPTGSWTLTLPRDVSSSALRFVYYSHVNDTVAAASATLDLNVHAGLAFDITPHIASVGRKIYFNGMLHGAPIPPGGKQLVLEASSGGEWVKFNTITTNAKGRFHASYRFKYPGPVTYHFRVVSPHEADFPFLDGSSNRVSVREH